MTYNSVDKYVLISNLWKKGVIDYEIRGSYSS